MSAAHWVAFTLLYPLSLCLVGGLVAVWVFAQAGVDAAPEVLEQAETFTGAGFLGATAVVQISALAVGALGLSLFLPRGEGRVVELELSTAKLSDVFALERPGGVWVAAAVVATVTLGLLPGWVAERLMQLPGLEAMADQMALLGEQLGDPSVPGWWILLVAVVVTAPICEELIFRGYLWRAAEQSLPPAAVWLVTSLFFAAYHVNPIHVLSVIPIGLFLGWLRWMSGSIWPGMLAHFVNNALAVGLTVALGPESTQPGLVVSALSFGLSLAVCGVAWAVARRWQEDP